MLDLSKAELEHVRFVQKTNKNKRDFIKASTIIMLHFGDHSNDVAARLSISVSTVYTYQRRYSELPLNEFLKDNYLPYEGKLSPVREKELKMELSNYLYATTAEVKEYIRHNFSVGIACSTLAKQLKRLGFSYKKTKLVPGKADPEKQAEWVENFQEIISQKNEDGVIVLLDGVHPMHNTKSDYGWVLKGQDFEIPANSGRCRLNINGATK